MMETCVKKYILFPDFFLVLNVILSDAFILPVSQLQIQKVMTLRNRSHIEYLMKTYTIFVHIF